MTGAIEGILFDLDGTLIDTGPLIAASFRYATEKVLGRKIPTEELLKEVGIPLRLQMEHISPEHTEELLEVYREHNHALHDSTVKEFPGIADMLKDLEGEGLKLGVVTSKRRPLALRGLQLFGYDGLMSCVVTPEDGQRFKPDPWPVLEGARRLGVDVDSCIYVGDSPYDIQAGNAAGMRTCAVRWGMFSEDVLASCDPTFMVDRPSQIEEILIGIETR